MDELTGSLREQLVPDIARGRGQTHAPGFTPARAVNFPLVTDCEPARGALRDENCVVHPAAGVAIFRPHLLPKPQPAQLQLGKLLSYFAAQTILCAFVLTFTAAREHPPAVTSASNSQNSATLRCYELGGLRHIANARHSGRFCNDL